MNDNNNQNQNDLNEITSRLNSAVRHSENAVKSGLSTADIKQKEYSIKHNDVNEIRDRVTDKDISTISNGLKTSNTSHDSNVDIKNIKNNDRQVEQHVLNKQKDIERIYENSNLKTSSKQYQETESQKIVDVKKVNHSHSLDKDKKDDLIKSQLKTKENNDKKIFDTEMNQIIEDKDFDLKNIKNKVLKEEKIEKKENILKTSTTQTINNKDDRKLNTLKTSLKNKESLAEKNGIHLKNKSGKIHSDNYIKGLGKLNQKTFGFKQNQSKKSKVGTVGLKSTKKITGTVGKGTRLATMGNTLANSEDAIESGVNTVKTMVKAPVNKVKNKMYLKMKHSAVKAGKKTIVASLKAVKIAMSAIIKVVATVLGSMSFLFIPCALILVVVCGFLSVFTGSPETRESYETIFTEIQTEFDDDIKSETKKCENKMTKEPSKETFSGISNEDYEKLIVEQWKKDTVSIEGFSQIDWKAQLVIIQNLKNNPEIENDSDRNEIKAVINYWKDKSILEKHETTSNQEKYKIKWINHYTENLEKKEISAKTKTECTKLANEYIFSLNKNDVEKIDKNFDYKEIKENYKDEEGNEHERTKEWKVIVTGTLHKKKDEAKEFTRTVYSISISNGHLNEYINQTNEAFKNNDTGHVGFLDDRKIKTLLSENDEYKDWQKINDAMDEQIRQMYAQEGFMDEFSEKFRGSDAVVDFGGVNIGEGNYPWSGTLQEWNMNNTFGAPRLNGQCTWFAYGRYYQTHNKHIPVHGNAGQWISECTAGGYTNIGKVPKVHSVIVTGSNLSTGEYAGCGHVAFIEAIENDGNGNIKSITISQGNIGAPNQETLMKDPFKYTDVRKFDSIDAFMKWLGSGRYLIGFIY